ncbi:Gfo/Idh/MocA family oxidoreductase [Aneurinibacillus sp. Ricciae_BoGa-3]|uniref:Gfo/Idh/MocA family protein n=1 Tax=Aneurinibacillus sp. Ricciae_BoGa-3 TaxID=3022697 RepID=UPI00234013AE|nr:Gfo/Idh/MocA family oxidoreductase [Aneurinibacillus sp. Ricciae_BoGa-3]WCK52640.1 Gfo/Idh/MocA family oxidoreductase [Aneurinibacillus sp. Ricciae_BoGa-3]
MIKFGVIGTNWITESFIKAASELDDFALTAVYSRTQDRAKEFAAQFGAPFIFTDLETMARSNEIDAVYIASPNSLHARQAILCLTNGKHVLCEKPLASNTAEIKGMIAAAKNNHVLLMEALKTTLLPNFKSIQENLHKIGPIRRYTASYCQYSSRYDKYKEGIVLNAFDPGFSNGSLMDIGIYCIYPAVVLFGKPEAVKATGVMLDSGVDGEGTVLLQYKDMDAVTMHSKITDSYIPSEIQGEAGSILIDKISTAEGVKINYRDGRTEDISQPQMSESMYYEAEEFIRLIQSKQFESSVNSYANSLLVAEIMEEARHQIGLVFPADNR